MIKNLRNEELEMPKICKFLGFCSITFEYISIILLNNKFQYGPIKKTLTLIRAGGGLNQPTETLKACRAVLDEGMIFKPSCKFHFWCLLTTEKMTLGVV